MNKKEFYNEIFNDKHEFKIWKKLDNGCYIATMNYSDRSAYVLMSLLKSFEEQYGEEITYESACEELNLYNDNGKLFLYLDEHLRPVSMNGCTYNEENVSVEFKSSDARIPSNLYFYGLSTLKEYRGKGACSELVSFAIEYAYYNNFDLVYARTDLTNSNSEGIMHKHGMDVCENDEGIIAEWVDVTDTKGDYRLHLWLPLKDDLYIEAKEGSVIANKNTRKVKSKRKCYSLV